MQQIRLAYLERPRIYWIQDNVARHWPKDIRDYAAANKVELIATTT